MKLRIALIGTFALAASVSAFGQAATDAGVGTWTLNVEKSKFDSGSALKSETRTYTETSDGLRMSADVQAANGQSHTESTTYKTDGKPYPISNNPDIDMIKVTRVSPREVRATQFRAGKEVGHLTRVVSKSGKTMTITSDVTTPSGQTEHQVRVYDRH